MIYRKKDIILKSRNINYSRVRRIIAALILVIGIAWLIGTFPNLLEGKEKTQTYTLTAQTQLVGDQLSDCMSQANTAMFARLNALKLTDFNVKQDGSRQIQVSLTPKDQGAEQALAVENAVDLLCRPGVVQFLSADGTVMVDNSGIASASLTHPDGKRNLITVRLNLMAAEGWRTSGSDPLSVTVDGMVYGTVSLSDLTANNQIPISITDPKTAKDLDAFLSSQALPCPFIRQQ